MREWLQGHDYLLLGVAAGVLLSLQLASEIVQMDGPITMAAVAFELVDDLLPVASTIACVFLALAMRMRMRESLSLRADLVEARLESERWRQGMADHLRALTDGIRRQFGAWRLTAAEQDVGILLLKGMSHKEIARVRKTSEATIRQQATAIYQKAGVSGRAALAAFFLDDLMADAPQAPPERRLTRV